MHITYAYVEFFIGMIIVVYVDYVHSKETLCTKLIPRRYTVDIYRYSLGTL